MLTVHIYSFSYVFGCIPEDTCGNGGGFVFDCRYINNPAFIEELRPYSGRDEQVIKFLDADDLMRRFLKNIYELTGDAVSVYLQRGYSDLMISFGCTGGQHRSVYCAEKLYQFIKENFPEDVKVELNHNMEKSWMR